MDEYEIITLLINNNFDESVLPAGTSLKTLINGKPLAYYFAVYGQLPDHYMDFDYVFPSQQTMGHIAAVHQVLPNQRWIWELKNQSNNTTVAVTAFMSGNLPDDFDAWDLILYPENNNVVNTRLSHRAAFKYSVVDETFEYLSNINSKGHSIADSFVKGLDK